LRLYITGDGRHDQASHIWLLVQVDVVLALGDSITAAFGAAGRRGGLVSVLE
jgi:hypothetical protein